MISAEITWPILPECCTVAHEGTSDTLSLIILKQLYFFTLKIYLYMFKGPMLIYKNTIRSHS